VRHTPDSRTRFPASALTSVDFPALGKPASPNVSITIGLLFFFSSGLFFGALFFVFYSFFFEFFFFGACFVAVVSRKTKRKTTGTEPKKNGARKKTDQ
jgi:hypothetical protein